MGRGAFVVDKYFIKSWEKKYSNLCSHLQQGQLTEDFGWWERRYHTMSSDFLHDLDRVDVESHEGPHDL